MDQCVGWLNGQCCPFSDMKLPVWDLGVVAGAGITEMARTYRHKPFRLAEHIRRLVESCTELQFELPYQPEQLVDAATDLVQHNVRFIAPDDDLGIVLFVTAGSNATYLGAGDLPGPTVGIHTFRLPFELWKAAATEGVRLTISQRTRVPQDCLPVHRKVRNRLHWWLADREAASREPGSRALLLDSQGRITETSTSCFYAIIDGIILTPQVHVLNSMSRQMVTEAAQACGLDVAERHLTPEGIPQFQEAFLSSTPVGIFRVASIDGHPVGRAAQSSVVPDLLNAWAEITGINPTSQILKGAQH